MSALNFKASHWIRQGIFDGIASFSEFESRVNGIAEEKDRGDVFEIFVEGYLTTQPIVQRVQHWVVGGIPLSMRERYNLPADATGIDGIYETHDGSHVAYQVKYRQKRNLTYAEVAPFLGITESFADRVIFTNASTLSDKASVRTRWFSSEAFNALSAGAFSLIEAWLKEKPAPILRATPDPRYQVQALADIDETLKKHDRATVVMACGTGKTLVALWAAERANPQTVLVLLPSLTLLQQTLREWSEQTIWGARFSYLCVCSDKTVGLKDDSLDIDKSDVGFRVDTDPVVVEQFLKRPTQDIKVVFSTYQSSAVVGLGAKTLAPFDLAIFDEAHKTTGFSGGAFGHALSDQNIQIRKRLFLTATPRHIDIRHRDKEDEFRVQSMDDESIYGPRAHTLSFSAAARMGIICQYKVIVSLIDKQMVDDFTRERGITIVDGDVIGARWVANLIALNRAIEAVGARKIISFHSRVESARVFATNEPRGIAPHLNGYDVRHVNGGQSNRERGEIIRAFAAQPNALLTNARCLTEGVDIPAVDMVAFIDPRQSRVDIAQAVGRAMRKPRGPTTKTVGYVVVPLFAGMGDDESLDAAIQSEKFDAVADVLNALQEHDADLVDTIREIRRGKGAGEAYNPRHLSEKMEVIGPRVDLDRLTASIGVEIADRIGRSWDEWFGLLLRFKEREGHCRVIQQYSEGTFKLGAWVSNQRAMRDVMLAQRRESLDAIGFDWDGHGAVWEEGFAALLKFKEREGHSRAPWKHVESGFKLGVWVNSQRVRWDIMPPERRERLDAVGFDRDLLTAQWENGFAKLLLFKEREGHCRVPVKHIESGLKLGVWVSVQRNRRDIMSPERRERLEAIGFDWALLTAQWEKGFSALLMFREREGHCRVPTMHVEGVIKLGNWVGQQRGARESMSAELRERLDTVGFVWDAFAAAWEMGFAALLKFKEREGHGRVPNDHVEGVFRLGSWVSTQRKSKDALPVERRERLDALGFDWDLRSLQISTQWQDGFAALLKFKEREGHCRVPATHVEETFKLGSWVSVQRRKDTVPSEQRNRLDAVGFDWAPLSAQWEEGFAALQRYKERVGHLHVPKEHSEGAFKLRVWINTQRATKDSMPPERRERLDALGFDWDPFSSAWEQGIAFLRKFKEREGHCRVPRQHIEGAFKLGQWVITQRTMRDSMVPERREKLDAVGFVWRLK